MIIFINNWKRKLGGFLITLGLVMAFMLVVPWVAGTLQDKIPVVSTWFQEEHPSGNPLRVDNKENQTKFDEAVDYLVFQLQNFYYEE